MKHLAQCTRTIKMKIWRETIRPKNKPKRVSCHTTWTQKELQGPKKAQQASNTTQKTPNQENKEGKKVYATIWANVVYIRSWQWDNLRVYVIVKQKGTYMLWNKARQGRKDENLDLEWKVVFKQWYDKNHNRNESNLRRKVLQTLRKKIHPQYGHQFCYEENLSMTRVNYNKQVWL